MFCFAFRGKTLVLFIINARPEPSKLTTLLIVQTAIKQGFNRWLMGHRHPSIRQVNQVVNVPIEGRNGHQ
jgi:hypothetical protein